MEELILPCTHRPPEKTCAPTPRAGCCKEVASPRSLLVAMRKPRPSCDPSGLVVKGADRPSQPTKSESFQNAGSVQHHCFGPN